MADEPGPKGASRPKRDADVPPDRYSIKVTVRPETLTELISKFDLDVGDRPHVEPQPDGRGLLYAFAPEDQIRDIEAAGYSVERGENVSATGRERMAEVATGDRFEGGRVPPRGLGQKPGRGEAPDGDRPGGDAEKGGPAR
jgi:hypothetical protein